MERTQGEVASGRVWRVGRLVLLPAYDFVSSCVRWDYSLKRSETHSLELCLLGHVADIESAGQ